ncbi:MAG TPA: glycoside hydrolase family 32 protein [Acidobacteriaceae bacterium]|nr:glycoside hydrolase family 32 protein [Acidobacteriaceae bacterium]
MKITRRNLLARSLAGGTGLYMFRRLSVCEAFAMPTQKRLAEDPRRPQFHLLPAAHWMNDPNGPIYWHGKYHMFYQYNPYGAYWGDMHWAHAVSPDMVHWTHLPIALAPTPSGPDAGGCFTGTTVVDAETVTAIYTGVVSVLEDQATIRAGANSLRESQCLAFSTDAELKQWTKLPKPIIDAPPAGMHVTGFRDPSPWRQRDWWFMTIGSGFPHQFGAVLLYRSKDLRHWEYLHVLVSGESAERNATCPVNPGDMWECPELFPLGDKHVLIFSMQGKTYWKIGDLDVKEMLFHPEKEGLLDYGSYYASKTQLDASGNRIVWGWILEARPLAEYRAAGWAGMMSLPRVVTLARDGGLTLETAPAVRVLRERRQALKISSSEEKNTEQIGKLAIQNCCGEVLCTFKPGADKCGLSLLGSQPNQTATETWLTLQYDPAAQHPISLDGTAIPVQLSDPHRVEVNIYIDGSVAEVSVNKQITYTKRFYYRGTDAPTMTLRVLGRTTNLSSLEMWQLSPISRNRLTT